MKNKIPQSLTNIDLKAVLRKRGIYKKQANWKGLVKAARPVAKEIIKSRKKDTAEPEPQHQALFTDEAINEYVDKKVHVIEVIEAKFETKINQFIKHVEKGFLDALDTEINKKNFTKFVQKDYFADNEDELLTKAQIDFTPLLENIATISGNDANKFIGVKEPYLPFDYRNKIIQNVNKFTKSMLSTDREHLIDVISQGLKDGKSNIEIRNTIEADFGEYSMNQAKRITTTEVARASQQAAIDAYEQSGIVEGLQWIIYGAVDECADYDGEVRSLDDNGFYSVDNEFQDGDPPLHPNCKCQLIPVVIGTEPSYKP